MKTLIFCEGKDEENFFQSYIIHLGLNLSDFTIKSQNGKGDYPKKFKTFLKTKEADEIGSVFLTCDSDGAFDSACDRLKGMISDNFNVKVSHDAIEKKGSNKYGFHIFDKMLESVCYESIAG